MNDGAAIEPGVSDGTGRLRRALLAAALAVLIGGCDKSPAMPGLATTAEPRAWIGTYAAASGGGALVLDVALTGTVVRGELVFNAPISPHLFVTGSLLGDSLRLAADLIREPAASAFLLRARLAGDSLTGTMSGWPVPSPAAFACHLLARRRVTSDEVHDVPYSVLAIVYDGQRIWLSTTGDDYPRLSTSGVVVDTVKVYYRGAHWTSGVLAFDGGLLWGALPGSVTWPGGATQDYSEILAFDANGRGPDSLRLWRRSAGLAYDGADFRSLHGSWIDRFDRTGAVLDSLSLGIPDPVHLEYDGGRFWTLGWYLKRLYEVDAEGRVVSICDLPGESTGSLPCGIAAEGTHLWYAESHVGSTTVHRLTVQ